MFFLTKFTKNKKKQYFYIVRRIGILNLQGSHYLHEDGGDIDRNAR